MFHDRPRAVPWHSAAFHPSPGAREGLWLVERSFHGFHLLLELRCSGSDGAILGSQRLPGLLSLPSLVPCESLTGLDCVS